MSLFSYFHTTNSDNDVVLFVELGSGSVACACVRYDASGAHTLASLRKDLPFQEKVTLARLYALIEDALKKNLDELSATHPSLPIPKHVCIALASPWCVSQTRVVRYSQDDTFQITKSSLQNIIQKEQELFLRDMTQQAGLFTKPIVISHQMMQARVNGYPVEHPIGRTATDIEIFTHYSAMSSHMHDVLENILHSRWSNVPISFQTYLFGIYVALRDGQSAHQSFVIADVASEVSDVAIVHEGVLLESLSFPIGTKSLVRSLAASLSLSPYVAETELHAHVQGKLSEHRSQRISQLLHQSLEEWGKFYLQAIRSFQKSYPLPQKVFLVARHWARPQFQKHIEEYINDELYTLRDDSREGIVGDVPEYQYANCHDPFLCVMMLLYKSYSHVHSTYHS